ncbi:UNKNOWN [Stylonychia lemnae]|uniref:Uncharacterized protein n=1 Tax=Stylonychia lemnae TaxID=5949 RepID=A0A078AFK1_STYLE|nr:UNKNOWN [Stylonychia lemnae]|eukprot:CDW81019.1 UNKNOWN [Stylonychia lemnae]
MNNLKRVIPGGLRQGQNKIINYIRFAQHFGTHWYGLGNQTRWVVYNINNGFSNFLHQNIQHTCLMENNFKKCVIDQNGDFKFIIIELTDINTQEKILLLRGSRQHEMHKDILAEFIAAEMKDDDDYQHVVCRGGGRISIDQEQIKIYGFSYAFGKADHQKAADIVRDSYPQFKNLIWSVDEDNNL